MMTVDEYLVAQLPDGKSELVRGELRMMPPPGAPHGRAAMNLAVLLSNHVSQHNLGMVFGDAVGYELIQFPHTVRVPDASFVRADRLPPEGLHPGTLKFAPDLAIEVLSPSECASEIEERLQDYIAAGTTLIWIVDPVRRTIMSVSTDTPVRWLAEGDVLDAGAVIPGFSCDVARVFDGIARQG